jgi:hypothetical protein
MRPRQAADWTTDLAERHDLEHQVARHLARHPAIESTRTATASMHELDFTATLRSTITITLELKTKRRPYSPWWEQQTNGTIAQRNLIIIDELTIRKLIDAAPHAYLLIADLTQALPRWYGYSIGDLIVADRIRVSRPLTRDGIVKGKCLYDLNDAPIAEEDLDEAIDGIDLLTRTVNACWHHIAPWPRINTRRTAA